MKAENILIQIVEAATGKTTDELLLGLFEDPQLPSVNFNDMPSGKALAMHEDLGQFAHEQGYSPTRVGVVKVPVEPTSVILEFEGEQHKLTAPEAPDGNG